MHAHEAGWAHAEGALKSGGRGSESPVDVNRAGPAPVVGHRSQGDDGVLADRRAGGRRPRRRAQHPGVRPRRGRLPRPRPRLPGRVRRLRGLLRRQGLPVHRRRPVGRRGGTLPRRVLRRRADGRAAGRASTRRGSATTATTRPCAELRRAVAAGVGRIIVDSFDEIDRLDRDRPARRGVPARVMVRVTAGVEAHTHEYIATAHEDQKFGFSITGGDGPGGGAPRAGGAGRSSCSACTPTSARRSSTPPASRWPPAGCSRCTPRSPRSSASTLPELDLGGGFGIAYTTQDDPADPRPAGRAR